MIKSANKDVANKLAILLRGESIIEKINFNLNYNTLYNNSNNIWSLLLLSGYLTVSDFDTYTNYYKLQIPNKEVLSYFIDLVNTYYNNFNKTFDKDKLLKALLNKNTLEITSIINDFMKGTISFRDSKESFYHGMMFGLLSGIENYIVSSNREAGYGLFDLVFYDYEYGSVGIIFEFKCVKKLDDLEKSAYEAMQQINEKDYQVIFDNLDINNIIKYGISFCGKKCYVIGGDDI